MHQEITMKIQIRPNETVKVKLHSRETCEHALMLFTNAFREPPNQSLAAQIKVESRKCKRGEVKGSCDRKKEMRDAIKYGSECFRLFWANNLVKGGCNKIDRGLVTFDAEITLPDPLFSLCSTLSRSFGPALDGTKL
jgi:hypothetical protein